MGSKLKWAVVLVAASATLFMCFWFFYPRISLKPGVNITQAHHYWGNGLKCHCIVIAGAVSRISENRDPDEVPSLPVTRIVRLEDVTSKTCTLIFESNGHDGYLCVYNFPLSKLNYNAAALAEGASVPVYAVKAVVILSSIVLIIVSATKLLSNSVREGGAHNEEGPCS